MPHHSPYDQVRYIQLETGTACNYKCVYCPVSYSPRKGGFIQIDTVRSLKAEFSCMKNLKKIYLNGYDEPSLNPQLPRIAETLASLRVPLVIFTNGTRLTTVNGGVKTGHIAAQNQASGGAPSAMARALNR